MFKRYLPVVVAAGLLNYIAPPCFAGEWPDPGYAWNATGQLLYQSCAHVPQDGLALIYCIAFIDGMKTGFEASTLVTKAKPYYCFPDTTTGAQLAREYVIAVTAQKDKHPELLTRDRAFSVLWYFGSYYKCKA
jgi:hypothetical protein